MSTEHRPFLRDDIAVKEFDAVVVGAGGAGLRASYQLAETGYKTANITKVYPTRSHTVSAQGGIAAALGNVTEDKWQWHAFDTIKGSDFLGDQDAIAYMCEHAPAAVIELEHMGLPFSRLDSGKIYQRPFGGHTQNHGESLARRTCAAADRTGHAMLHTLYQKNIESGTQFFNEWFVLDLVKDNRGGVCGVLALCMETSECVFLKSRAVVLATGGGGRIYRSNTNAYINTGDGMGMIARAGLPLQDMEFWQFHPTGIAGVGCLITEGARGEGGFLLNKDKERFMERYSPHLKDLDCRDIVSRSSVMEILAGRGAGVDGDHVLLQLSHLGEQVLHERLPGITELAKRYANVDPAKDPIPVVPTCHYQMGGIPTNYHGQVLTQGSDGVDQVVPGLYAAGECACVSVHGANRLGTNSLLDLVVFGRAVGMFLQDELAKSTTTSVPNESDIENTLSRLNAVETQTGGTSWRAIRSEMQAIMQDYFGVFRDDEPMQQGLERLLALRQQLQTVGINDHSRTFNMERIELLELHNLMDTAIATASSAHHRTESRGAHSRYDFKARDDQQWHKHTLHFSDGRFGYRPVNMTPGTMENIPLQERE